MIKVLLVDDHELVRTGIRRLLEEAPDIEVTGEAGSGQEALGRVRVCPPDVVLMDLNMPGMGGIETTRRLAKTHPEVRVIALTVEDEDPFPGKLHDAGAQGYLTKGCPAEEMLKAIRKVARGLPYVDAHVAKKHMESDWEGAAKVPFERLSTREMEVAMMILGGRKTQAIAEALHVSPKTVSTYRQRIYEKLNIATDVELTRLAYRFGIIQDPD